MSEGVRTGIDNVILFRRSIRLTSLDRKPLTERAHFGVPQVAPPRAYLRVVVRGAVP